MNKLVAAETAAQADMVGIWSDQFKSVRDKMGLTPLATMEAIK
jgi:endonuclease YncB( thermonuclease family)